MHETVCMKGQKRIFKAVDANEVSLRKQQFTDLSETFLQTMPSFVLRGPIYVVLLILVAAVIYSSITSINVKVDGYLTVKGEEYVIQSPVSGTVSLIYQANHNTLQSNENLLAIYSQSAFSKSASLTQISQKKSELENEYHRLLLFQIRIDSLAALYARRNREFDLLLPSHESEYNLSIDTLLLHSDQLDDTYIGAEFDLKYSDLRQKLDLLWQEYDRTARASRKLAATYRENARLLEQRFISRQEFVNSERAYDAAKSSMETLARNIKAELLAVYQQNLQRIEIVRSNLFQLEQENETIKLMLAGIEISGNSIILKNRYPGVITDIFVSTSQMVSEGMSLVRIIRDDYPLIGVINLPVSRIGQVKTGQDVAIRYDAFPYQIFGVQKGRIISVSDDVKLVDGHGYAYEITIALDTGPKVNLKPGMGGMAEIVTGEKRIIEVAIAPVSKILDYFRGED